MKTKTMSIFVPVVLKDEDGNITGLDTKERFYGIPSCVISEPEFNYEVQRYINIAYADFFQWNADRLFSKYERTNKDEDHALYMWYSEFADNTAPCDKNLECDFAFLYAFCIDKQVRTHYYRDSKGKYTSCGVTCGEYGVELYELFSDYSMNNINDNKMSIARQQLRAWYGDIIKDTPYCKQWNTSKITIDTTRRLINYAGTVKTDIRRDFKNKRTGIADFTQQALAKCFQSCFKMKLEETSGEIIYTVK